MESTTVNPARTFSIPQLYILVKHSAVIQRSVDVVGNMPDNCLYIISFHYLQHSEPFVLDSRNAQTK